MAIEEKRGHGIVNKEFVTRDVGYSGRAVSESHRSSLFPIRFRSTEVAPSIVAESIDGPACGVKWKFRRPVLPDARNGGSAGRNRPYLIKRPRGRIFPLVAEPVRPRFPARFGP